MAQVRGLNEIQAALKSLPVQMQRNVLGAGNRALAKTLAEEATAGADLPEKMRRAIHFSSNRKSTVTKGFLVGFRRPWSRLAHLFEFGTGLRFQKKTGRYTGFMMPNPTLRAALARMGGDRAAAIWAKAAGRNFDLQMKKLQTKLGR